MRKKIFKRGMLIVLVLVLLLASVVIFAYTRYLHPTGRIMSGLYAVRNDRNNIPMVNFFILQAGDKYIAIDSGSDTEQTQNALQRLGISTDDVIAVFLTESAWDHIGGLSLFNNATVYSWDTEFRYAEKSTFSPVFEHPNLPHLTMNDGEIIELFGRSIQCIYTPGHNDDSVSYVVDGKYLFVGNLFYTLNWAHDRELQIQSREKVLNIDGVEYVFTGHFGLFKDIRFFKWWWL